MCRMTPAVTLVVLLLAPALAAAEMPGQSGPVEGMCEESGQLVQWTAPFAHRVPTPVVSSPWLPEASGNATNAGRGREAQSSWSIAEVAIAGNDVPLEAENILWCVAPDDPRCSPVDDREGGRRLSVRDAASGAIGSAVARPFQITLRLRAAAQGGPRAAHGPLLKRPPRA